MDPGLRRVQSPGGCAKPRSALLAGRPGAACWHDATRFRDCSAPARSLLTCWRRRCCGHGWKMLLCAHRLREVCPLADRPPRPLHQRAEGSRGEEAAAGSEGLRGGLHPPTAAPGTTGPTPRSTWRPSWPLIGEPGAEAEASRDPWIQRERWLPGNGQSSRKT